MTNITLAVLTAARLLNKKIPIMRTVITIAMIATKNAGTNSSTIIITSRSRFSMVQTDATLVLSWKLTRQVKMRAMLKSS